MKNYDELEIVNGYLKAEYDCPVYEETVFEDHDCQGETLECEFCKTKFIAGNLL